MKQLILLMVLVSSFAFPNRLWGMTVVSESKLDSLYTVVCNSQRNHKEKIDIIKRENDLLYSKKNSDRVFLLFNTLLQESKTQSDVDGIIYCYNSILEMYLNIWDEEKSALYLDSASMYISQIGDIKYLAAYYRLRGQYLQRYYPDKSPEAVLCFQKALSYYEKIGIKGNEYSYVTIMRNLTLDGIQRNDISYIKKNIEKMKGSLSHIDSPAILFDIMDLTAAYYEQCFQENNDNTSFLDSSIFYTRKCLDIYEKGVLPETYELSAIDLYVVAAESMSKKPDMDFAVIDSFLSIGKSRYDKTDTLGWARIYQIEARAFIEKNMLDSAEHSALKSLEYVEAGRKNNYYSLYNISVQLLGTIYYKKGDYKQVIKYENLRESKAVEIRANEVKELELSYESDSKASEIEQLNSKLLYQERRHKMVIIIIVILCVLTLLFFMWIWTKRTFMQRKMQLINAAKEEAKLNLKLKEEQAVKADLEKYEVLSDFHLKEMELIGKNKDLEQLYSDKDELDKQVELYRQKIEEYESSLEKNSQTDIETRNIIIDDLRTLVEKRLPSRDDYIRQINQISESYISAVKEKYEGNISVPYIKYCICFAIGMEISEVADCFSIEQASVHMVRYRLKKKFNLNNDEDLDVFLRNIENKTEN